MKQPDAKLIIVTGGAGLIGSCVIKALNNRGFHQILLIDELGNDEKWKNLVGKRFMDALTPDELLPWLKGRENQVQGIIHLGACSDTMETDASFLMKNNYRYSVDLARAAITHSLRFVYASSAATYGDGSLGFLDDDSALHSLQSLNMYGLSKQLFDQWAANHHVLDKIAGLKYFNVFGPNEYHKGRMASAICKMVPNILQGKSIQLFRSCDPKYADGEQLRDFIYVKDAVEMTLEIFKNDQANGLFNVGSGESITWKRLAEAVFSALNLAPKIEFIDMPKELIGKYQNYSCADMTKTKKALQPHFKCRHFEDAVKEVVCDYLATGKRW
jgi:ADP-L-glycero-D-manno-heptose 6-epimerase